MSTKNIILTDKNGNQLAPATTADQVSYDENTNVKQAINKIQYLKTPEMFGAVGDGITDDTSAFKAALNSGYKVIANNSYKLSELIFTDDSILESNAVYTRVKPYISKAVKKNGSIIVDFEKAIWNSDLISDTTSAYINGAVYDSDNNVVILGFGDSNNQTAYIVTTDTNFNKIAEYVSSVAGHAAGGAYNPKTKKVYFASGLSNNGKAYLTEYTSSATGVSNEKKIELSNFPQVSCSAVMYDKLRDQYFIGSGGHVYIVDANFNYVTETAIKYNASIMASAVGIDNNGVGLQSLALKDDQLLHLWHNGSADYSNQHDSISYWISQYNYKTGDIKMSYRFNSIAGHDEIESICEINGKWYIFQALRNALTYVSRIYFDEDIQASKNETVNTGIPKNTDLNDLIRYGMYHTRASNYATSLVNSPFQTAFILYVLPNAYGDYICQIAISVGNETAIRTYNAYNSIWTEWKYLNKVADRGFTPTTNTVFNNNATKVLKQGNLCLVKIDGAFTGNNVSGWVTIGTVSDSAGVSITAANVITNSGTRARFRVSGNNLQVSYSGNADNIGTQFMYATE